MNIEKHFCRLKCIEAKFGKLPLSRKAKSYSGGIVVAIKEELIKNYSGT